MYIHNYTGLLNDPHTKLKTLFLTFLLWIWTDLLLLRATKFFKHRKISFLLFNLFVALTTFIPYKESGELLSSLHVSCAYICFFLYNWIYVSCTTLYPNLLKQYLFACIPSILFCFLHLSITGTAEILYACVVSIFLTKLVFKNNE